MDEEKKAFQQDRGLCERNGIVLLLLFLELFRFPGPNQSQSEVYSFNMKLPGLSDLTGQKIERLLPLLKRGCHSQRSKHYQSISLTYTPDTH